MKIYINLDFIPSFNKIIKYFIIGDLLMWVGWGLIEPVFAIFIVREIQGASLISVGILATIYWVSKGIIQIPVSLFLDRTPGEKDDFYSLILGLMIIAVAAFIFIIVEDIRQAYFVQFIKAFGFALYIPAWTSIFSRHLDKDHTAFDWAFSSSSVSICLGAATFLSGVIATAFGFRIVFLLGGLLALISAIVLLLVPNLILPEKPITKDISPLKDHRVI